MSHSPYIHARTKSADDTKALAAEVAAFARPGDIILLSGDLGTGKSVFARGFGAALGITEPITSPTFVLMRAYEGGRLPMVHLDVYRLEHLQEAIDLGLTEVLDEGGVALIEWGDLVASALPTDLLVIELDRGEGDDDRDIVLRAVGSRWPARCNALRGALSRWLITDDETGGAGC